jgi:hypothetical protein
MKMTSISTVLVSLVLLSVSAAQQPEPPKPKGTIFGMVIDHHGRPAKHLGLVAEPLGVALAAMLPHTRTDDEGKYRFENVPWWGTYTVYAQDEDAGYSDISNGPAGNSHPPQVEISREHPEAEFNITLPPKAGFIRIHLTNRRTGGAISGMEVALMPMEKADSPLFTMSCHSDHVILVPPDENLLLHINSDGFHEWDESVGNGKPLNLPSGGQVVLNVQLEPLN